MSKTFKGRAVIKGSVTGEALVSAKGVNMLATYRKSLIMKAKKAVCSDQDNTDIFGRVISGKILCLPQTIGSTTGGIAIMTAAGMNVSPKAMLFSSHIDTLAASGIILADIWQTRRIITIDSLGDDFLASVKTGDSIEVHEDGTVVIS